MKKKVLAVLLGGCMVVGMLAGCGGGGDDAKKDEGAKTEATDEGKNMKAKAAETIISKL